MSAGEGVVLFVEMMLGPFSRAFLHPGSIGDVFSSPILIVLAVVCIGSFLLPILRPKKSSIYAATAGAILWILSGVVIIGAASM